MKSTTLKARIANELNIPVSLVAARTIPSSRSDRWVDVRIRPTQPFNGLTLSYAAEFPELHRRVALAIVYGEQFARGQAVGGNVTYHHISLFESQWDRFVGALNAIAACANPDATLERRLEVAFAWLNHRTITPV